MATIANILDARRVIELFINHRSKAMYRQLSFGSGISGPTRWNVPHVLLEALTALLDRAERLLTHRSRGWAIQVERLLATATELLVHVRQHLHSSPFALSTAINMQFAIAQLSERLSKTYDLFDAAVSVEQ